MSTRYIFVTGGVVSSLGKGITAASLGRLLTARGLKVIMQKCDPYINVDPGTMNPYEHGEVFVTEDGAETDLDLGHYERFTDIPLSRTNSVSSGQIYLSVIQKERQGEYLGGTVQVVPRITNEIKSRILSAPEDTDVVITEIGGTVGDIESQPFLEAIRQLRWELADQQALYIHVTLVPYLESSGELKTKPTQHSVKELSGLGIQPDIVVCRRGAAGTDWNPQGIGIFQTADRGKILDLCGFCEHPGKHRWAFDWIPSIPQRHCRGVWNALFPARGHDAVPDGLCDPIYGGGDAVYDVVRMVCLPI